MRGYDLQDACSAMRKTLWMESGDHNENSHPPSIQPTM
jgi:hypothetical protein